MITFHEYAAWRRKSALPDAETMLQKAGIDPHGPHEIDIMRMVKTEKKRTAQAPPATSQGIVSPSGRQGMPNAAKTVR